MKVENLREAVLFGGGAIFLMAVITTLIIFQGQKPPESSLHNGGLGVEQVSAQIPQEFAPEISLSGEQSTVNKPDDFIVLFPAGAVEEKCCVVLSSRDPSILSAAGDPNWRHGLMANISLTDAEGKLRDTKKLPVTIEVCFVLNDVALAGYKENPENYRVEYFNEDVSPARWDPLPKTAYLNRGLLCGQTDYVALFALAVYTGYPVPVAVKSPQPYQP